MTDYIPTTGYVRDFYSKFQPSILLDKGPNRQERACAEFDRWLTQVRAEAVSEFAKQHGIGDATSRPLYDAQQRIAELASEVEWLRSENRRLAEQAAPAEADTLREAAGDFAFTDDMWRDCQGVPGQGYSHRDFLEHVVGKWLRDRADELEGEQ